MTCDKARDLIALLRSANLEGLERGALGDHLRGCGGCREALTADDPSFVFEDLAAEPLPPDFWDGFQESLMARLPEGKPGAGWADLFRYPKLAYAAPLVAAVLLGVTVLAVRPGGVFAPRDRAGAIPSPYTSPRTAIRPGRIAPPPGVGASLAPALEMGPSPAPLLEEAGSPGARIYRFDAAAAAPDHGAGQDDETPIYLVVDESIDL